MKRSSVSTREEALSICRGSVPSRGSPLSSQPANDVGRKAEGGLLWAGGAELPRARPASNVESNVANNVASNVASNVVSNAAMNLASSAVLRGARIDGTQRVMV